MTKLGFTLNLPAGAVIANGRSASTTAASPMQLQHDLTPQPHEASRTRTGAPGGGFLERYAGAAGSTNFFSSGTAIIEPENTVWDARV